MMWSMAFFAGLAAVMLTTTEAGIYGGNREVPTWRLPKELRGPKKTAPLVWDSCDKECGNGIRMELSRGWKLKCNWFSCDSVLPCQCGATDLLFVMDNSGSIGKINYWRQKQFIQDVMHGFHHLGGEQAKDSRIAMVDFANEAYVDFSFTDGLTLRDLDTFDTAVWDIPYLAGHTNMSGGLKFAEEIFRTEASDNKKVAVLLTDGIATLDVEETIPTAQLLRAAGVGVFAIGIGDIDEDQLRAIVSEPSDEFYFEVTRYKVINKIVESVIEATCCTVRTPECTKVSSTSCSVTCGGGIQTDTIYCKHFGFADIVTKEENVVVQVECATDPCPIVQCSGGQSPGDEWRKSCSCMDSGLPLCEETDPEPPADPTPAPTPAPTPPTPTPQTAVCDADGKSPLDEWVKTCQCTDLGTVCDV